MSAHRQCVEQNIDWSLIKDLSELLTGPHDPPEQSVLCSISKIWYTNRFTKGNEKQIEIKGTQGLSLECITL